MSKKLVFLEDKDIKYLTDLLTCEDEDLLCEEEILICRRIVKQLNKDSSNIINEITNTSNYVISVSWGISPSGGQYSDIIVGIPPDIEYRVNKTTFEEAIKEIYSEWNKNIG